MSTPTKTSPDGAASDGGALADGALAGDALVEAPIEQPAASGLDALDASADRELLEQLLSDGAVSTEPAQISWTDYFGDSLFTVLRGAVEWLFGSASINDTAVVIVQWLIIGLVALLVALLALQWLRWFRRRSMPREVARPELVPLDTAAENVDWRAELDLRLDRGDTAGALEALWWWLAIRLGQADADASWTTRELARRAGRRDLMPLVRRWDHLAYGGAAVDIEQIRELWLGLQEKLRETLRTETPSAMAGEAPA